MIEASLLVYDIPEAICIPNPSRELRRVGFRANLSVWVIRNDLVPWNLLHSLTEGGAHWRLVKFDASESSQLLAMAIASLEIEVKNAVERNKRSMRAADASMSNPDMDKVKRYRMRTASALKRSEAMLADALECAVRYGVSLEDGVNRARIALEALSASAAARGLAYHQMALEAQGTLLGEAAQNSEVPAGVLADYLEEQGHDQLAARAAFAE